MIAPPLILTSLAQNPELFQETMALIEEEFHYKQPHRFEEDFSPLVNPQNFENCYVVYDQEKQKVAAHLSVCPRQLIKNDILLPVAFIGGIVTEKNYRGQQLFRYLMDVALEEFSPKVGLFILWSEIEGLYEKFNFFRTGGIIETGKAVFDSSERLSGYEKTKFNKLSHDDFERVALLYSEFNQKYFFTPIRQEKDWSIIKEMTSIDLFVKRNLEGEIERYFCVNKGRDLTNIIHEVSCLTMSDYQYMLKELSHFKLWLPESEKVHFNQDEIFYTAFIRMGSSSILNSFLQNISSNHLTFHPQGEHSIEFNFENKTYQTNEREFLQFLFGPRPLKEFEPLKLSPYIPGCDSI